MPGPPELGFFVATESGDVPADSAWLKKPLPLDSESRGAGPDFADYFGALVRALSRDQWGPLCAAAGLGGAPVRVRVVAEKHGALYHPARVEVETPGGRAALAANVALNPAGRALAQAEHGLLNRVAGMRSRVFVPQALGLFSDEGALPVTVLLTRWFSGYYEFHLSGKDGGGFPEMVLWDTCQGPRPMTRAEALATVSGASRILAYYYDPGNFLQISPWHHAAGDFVARPGESGCRVRLITVRGYGPFMEGEEDLMARLQGALFFFVNLTLRMRLDRDQGTGERVFAGPAWAAASAEGFFQGLGMAAEENGDGEWPVLVKVFLKEMGEPDFVEAGEALLSVCDPGSGDTPFLADRVREHARDLVEALKSE